MTDADKLAKVLAEHSDYAPDDDSSGDVCAGCFAKLDPDGDSHAGSLAGLRKHQAAVVLAHLTAEGWAQGREEWGVVVHEPKFVDHGRLITNYRADREAAEKFAAPRRFYSLARRRVTDWEPVEGEQP